MLLGLLLMAPSLRAWVFDEGGLWKGPTVPLQVLMGDGSFSGVHSANASVSQAALDWNPYMGRIQITTTTGPRRDGTIGDGINSIWASSRVDGERFPSDVLAVTLIQSDDQGRVETDIVINSDISWKLYRGQIDYNQIDLRRVVTHEVGHVLGLDHADTRVSSALMEPYVGVDSIQYDDMYGIAVLYGPGYATPMPNFGYVRSSSYEVIEPDPVSFQASFANVPYSNAQLNWYKDGVLLPSRSGSTTWTLESTKLSDSGTYVAELSVPWGKVRSVELPIVVKLPPPPVLNEPAPADLTFDEGYTLRIIIAASGRGPITYRLRRNGSVIYEFQTTYSYGYYNNFDLYPSDSGEYQCEASNSGGTTVSGKFKVTVNPAPAPRVSFVGPKVVRWVEGMSGSLTTNYWVIHPTSVRWFKDGVLLPADWPESYGTNFVRMSHAGEYQVEIANASGVTRSEKVRVEVIPNTATAGVQPATSPIETSSLSIPGNTPMASCLQWYRDGIPIPGATSSSVATTIPGRYTCVRTSGLHSVRIVDQMVLAPRPTNRLQSAKRSADTLYYTDGKVVHQLSLKQGTWAEPVPLPYSTREVSRNPGYLIARYFGEIFVRSDTEGNWSSFRMDESIDRLLTDGTSTYVVTRMTLEPEKTNIWLIDPAKLTVTKVGTLPYYLPNGGRLTGLVINGKAEVQIDNNSRRLTPWTEATGVSTRLPDPLADAETHGASLFLGAFGCYYDIETDLQAGILGYNQDAALALPDGNFLTATQGTLRLYDASMKLLSSGPAPFPHGLLVLHENKPIMVNALLGDTGPILAEIDVQAFAPATPLRAELKFGEALSKELSFVDIRGNLVIAARNEPKLLVWSPVSKTFTKAIPLSHAPLRLAYSPWEDAVYYSAHQNIFTYLWRQSFNEGAQPSPYGPASLWAPLCTTSFGPFCNGDLKRTPWAKPTAYHESDDSVWHEGSKTLVLPTLSNDSSPENWVLFIKTLSVDASSISSKYFSIQGTLVDDGRILGLSQSGNELLFLNGQVLNLADKVMSWRTPHTPSAATWWKQGATERLYATHTTNTGDSVIQSFAAGTGASIARAEFDGETTKLHTLPDGRIIALVSERGASSIVLLSADLVVEGTFDSGSPSRLVNLSIQADVGTGDDILVPGFVMSGEGSKTLLLRATGPGLAQFNVPGLLEDPRINLLDSKGSSVGYSDDWQESMASRKSTGGPDLTAVSDPGFLRAAIERAQHESLLRADRAKWLASELGAFPLQEGSLDSALPMELATGLYTAQVSDLKGGTGRSLIELYDADGAPGDQRLVNMSARCRVTGTREAIGGFVLKGDKPLRILIRAVGPKLADYHVTGVLANPRLRLFKGTELIATNDDWDAVPESGTELREAFRQTGAFNLEPGSKDAALVLTLEAGAYTVWMESADGSSGVCLLELYEVSP